MQVFSIAKLQRCCALPLRAALLACLVAPAAGAGELVVNGGFESHTGTGASLFDGWTIATQPGGQGGFYAQTAPLSPTNNMAVPAPPAGSSAAMSDQQGPSSQVLYQDITLPAGTPATLSLRLLVSNQANDFVAPASLDYNVATPNQQARIDIVNPSAPVLDLGAGVLRNLYSTQPGDPRSDSYNPQSWDLSAFAGQTVRLRIAEADNLHGFNLGVDAVSLLTGTHTPTSYTDLAPKGGGSISANLSGGGSGCVFDSSSYTATTPPEGPPPGIIFPYGFFVFKVTGCTPAAPITLTMHYPGALPAGTAYWKFGPTPDNHTAHWYTLPSTISGNSVTFTIVDGGLGDDDLLQNGSITDLGGPGATAAAFATNVPTLSPAALLALGLLLAFVFWRTSARRNADL